MGNLGITLARQGVLEESATLVSDALAGLRRVRTGSSAHAPTMQMAMCLAELITTTYYLLLTTYCYLLLTATYCYLLLATYCVLLTTYHLLLTTYCLLHTTYYLLLRCLAELRHARGELADAEVASSQ